LAQSGHYATEFQCPLLGVKRTLVGDAAMSAFDRQAYLRRLFRVAAAPALQAACRELQPRPQDPTTP
jgi:hypothetical protein